MLIKKRSTKLGAALIIFAILLRLVGAFSQSNALVMHPEEPPESGLLRPTTGTPAPPQTQATQGTMAPTQGTTTPPPTQATQTTAPPTTQPPPPPSVLFYAQDLQYVRVQYAQDCSHRPDVQKLLLQTLAWDLCVDAPTVLIVHSHASESFTRQPGQTYTESADYRTLDTAYNMVAVGDLLAQRLTQAGIGVIHDRQIHDYPSYTASYNNSRASVQAYLAQYPTIQVVLDLHRDAAEYADGSQYATSATVNGKKVAQIMFVVGSDGSGNYHPRWQENLATALKLQALLEQQAPGITRQTILRAQRFNHDLSTGAMIVEVGAAGNTLEEAMGAIPILADALIQLMYGANRS